MSHHIRFTTQNCNDSRVSSSAIFVNRTAPYFWANKVDAAKNCAFDLVDFIGIDIIIEMLKQIHNSLYSHSAICFGLPVKLLVVNLLVLRVKLLALA
jgi:hypothetical protein